MYKKVEGGEEMACLLFVFCFTMAFCQTTVSKMSKITVRRISAEEMPCLHHLVEKPIEVTPKHSCCDNCA